MEQFEFVRSIGNPSDAKSGGTITIEKGINDDGLNFLKVDLNAVWGTNGVATVVDIEAVWGTNGVAFEGDIFDFG